jgi:hypothetical protein
MVEGPVDQVLLAGASTYLRTFGIASKRESLDLNEITIVPAEGATNIPYLTYLARGRDSEQPAVIVLLDSDDSGNQAKKELTEKGYGPRKKPPLKKEFVLQVGDLASLGVTFPEKLVRPEVEDLIPIQISVMAAKKYASDVCSISERDIRDITEDFVQQRVELGETMFDAVNACIQACSKDPRRLDKVGFARSVIEVIHKLRKDETKESKYTEALEKFESNFKILFRELDRKKSLAELERTREKASQKIRDIEESFFTNHPNNAYREDVVVFLDKLEALLIMDDSFDSDEIRKGIGSIRNDYKLNINLGERVDNYEHFKHEVQRLKYLGKLASQEKQENDESNAEDVNLVNSSLENPNVTNSSSENAEPASSSSTGSKFRRSKTSKKENQGGSTSS